MIDATLLKERVCRAIDKHRDEIVALGEDVRLHPELGYKEHRTAALVSDHLTKLGISHETGVGLTGIKGRLSGRTGTATVAYMGELDSILVRHHPDADPVTGAAHACGHNAQIANLIGLAYGLVESGVMAELDGDVVLMAVPAEEAVEIEYRLGLREAGKIEFLVGKPELLSLGAFDDVQLVMMTHQASDSGDGLLSVAGPSNGLVIKQMRYIGQAAHAGGLPHMGINALKAAMLALQAIDANRETFRDQDHIRVHPIITKGGELVNVIPADVRLETYVRGATIEAIIDAAKKVDRCLKAGAMAMGATLELTTLPGCLPRVVCEGLREVYRNNVVALVGEERWWDSPFGAGSSDLGDLSHVLPAIEARAGGASGLGHGADYLISDEETAYITPAKVAAMTMIDLLVAGAAKAKDIVANFRPPMTKTSYLEAMRALTQDVSWTAPQE